MPSLEVLLELLPSLPEQMHLKIAQRKDEGDAKLPA